MASDIRDWPKQTWRYPFVHDVNWGFGLDIDDTSGVKRSTIVPFAFQDNAIVDYELIKVNPQNEDYAQAPKPNCAAGSYIPKVMVSWTAWSPSAEVDVLKFNTMDIHTAMLNRLQAFDKKTGTSTALILELQSETTDEQCFPLWANNKLYEGHQVQDYPAEVPGLTTTQQPEDVAWNMETYFDALHYYTNKEMLRTMTDKMKTHFINGPLSSDRRTFEKVARGFSTHMPSICKYMHPYTFFGKLFTAGTAGTRWQMANDGDVTAVEHLTVMGRTRFNEYNPDFNFARA